MAAMSGARAPSEEREAVVGILGGMGPEATVRLFELLTAATPATCDQEHLRVLVYSNPRIPDRTAAILGRGEDPLPALLDSALLLEKAGADSLIIPCNTAHHWLPQLRERVGVPILDMVAETVGAVATHAPPLERIGLLATTGTVEARVYQSSLVRAGLAVVETTPAEQEFVMAVIYGIKAGNRAVGSDLVRVGRNLIERGAQGLILGCTELSLVEETLELGCPLFDPLAILARRAVAIAKGADGGVPRSVGDRDSSTRRGLSRRRSRRGRCAGTQEETEDQAWSAPLRTEGRRTRRPRSRAPRAQEG
jgi:aspartate racemase